MSKQTLVFNRGEFHNAYPYDRTGPSGFPHAYDLPMGSFVQLSDGEWYRSDRTPVLLRDVPKEYRAMALLLT